MIKCSGKAAEISPKINVNELRSNVNQRDSSLGTFMTHALQKEAACIGSVIKDTNM